MKANRDDSEPPAGPRSGTWTGYYLHHPQGNRHPQEMRLHFMERGRVSGWGTDDVGTFQVRGSFDDIWGETTWLKYYEHHAVKCHGFYDGATIFGTWTIAESARGGFRIWPAIEKRVDDVAAVMTDVLEKHARKNGISLQQAWDEMLRQARGNRLGGRRDLGSLNRAVKLSGPALSECRRVSQWTHHH